MVNARLYISRPERYFENVVKILREDVGGESVIYVTTNKPYSHLNEMLSEDGVDTDGIFFIDCISRQVLDVRGEFHNCLYVDSPDDVTALAMAVDNATRHLDGDKLLFLDSLSTLLLYNDEKVIGQFSNFIINRMVVSGVSSIIMALSSDMEKDVIKKVMSFVDEVKEYDV